MYRNGGLICTKRLNYAIKSKEMASDWKISAHTFGMDFSVSGAIACSDSWFGVTFKISNDNSGWNFNVG